MRSSESLFKGNKSYLNAAGKDPVSRKSKSIRDCLQGRSRVWTGAEEARSVCGSSVFLTVKAHFCLSLLNSTVAISFLNPRSPSVLGIPISSSLFYFGYCERSMSLMAP